MKAKDKRGGKRTGAGRKKGEETEVVQIRVKKKHADNLRELAQRFKSEQDIRDKFLNPKI